MAASEKTATMASSANPRNQAAESFFNGGILKLLMGAAIVRKLFAQLHLNPVPGRLQQTDGVRPVVNAVAAVILHEIQIEPRFLDIVGNLRLFAAARTGTARREIAGRRVFPGT